LKRIALVLCAAIATLGAGAAATAQNTPAQAQSVQGAVGTATKTDETTLAIGDAAANKKADTSALGSTTFSYFLRMIVVLALVVAAIYGLYRLMRRVARPKTVEDDSIRLLASKSLGPGKALHVVAMGTKAYLVGAADAAISLLAQIDDKDFIDELFLKAAQNPQKTGPGNDFGEMLAGILGHRKKKTASSESAGDFLASQRRRLSRF
jgi:flagellar protein FliO/FliZ